MLLHLWRRGGEKVIFTAGSWFELLVKLLRGGNQNSKNRCKMHLHKYYPRLQRGDIGGKIKCIKRMR